METPRLSIIIPAYNEEERIGNALDALLEFAGKQDYPVEILVVENGSADRTLEIARDYAKSNPLIKALHEDGKGKGLAVRTGMLAAQGMYRFICDSDLSMPPDEINKFLPEDNQTNTIMIASREAEGSIRYDEPEYRHFIGRVFNFLVRVIALPGLHDSQCGFKCFPGEVAKKIFPLQTIDGWTFDVEVLYIARKFGYPITEVPISWYFDSHSKIKVIRDSLQMLFDLIKIRLNDLQGKYKQVP